jgi:hypothetical protein
MFSGNLKVVLHIAQVLQWLIVIRYSNYRGDYMNKKIQVCVFFYSQPLPINGV